MNGNNNHANKYNRKPMCCALCGRQSTIIAFDNKYKQIQMQKYQNISESLIVRKYLEYECKYIDKKWHSSTCCEKCYVEHNVA